MNAKFSPEQVVAVSDQEQSILIYDFSGDALPSAFSFNNIDAELVSQGAGITCGEQALKIHCNSAENMYTSVYIEPETPFDWSKLADFSFAFDTTNTGNRCTQIFINIFDHKGQMHSRSVNVAAGVTQTNLVELKGEFLRNTTSCESGLRSDPASFETPFEYATWMWGLMNIDLTAIAKIELSIHGTLIDHDMVLDNFRLIMSPEHNRDFLKASIDRFGQDANTEFAEKVQSEEDLLKRMDDELSVLEEGAMPDRSRFGGYTAGERYEATGFFRTQKLGDTWALIDPEGYPYFATGIDILRLANSYTITGVDYDHSLVKQRTSDDLTPEDSMEKLVVSKAAMASGKVINQWRRDFFQWLPDIDDPLAEHYSYAREVWEGPVEQGQIFSFYGANLQRKYGKDYMETWRKVTIDRMVNWGFTSLGNWTAPEFYENETVPFFANGWIIGDFKTVSSGDDFWAALPDPFDPLFRTRAEATVAQVREEIKDTPWCVGIFIDNEKSWGRMGTIEGQYGISIHTLGRDAAECPTKAVFVELMKDKYSSIDALNASWSTAIASWDAFAKGVKDLEHNDAQLEDYAICLEAYASEYFRVVNESLKAVLPNHLYLGSRFADWGMTPEVVRACAKHVDVVSYNYYKEGLHPQPWKFLAEIDMPSIIGEYHFGVKGEGLHHAGLVTASCQEERGKMYEAYMHSVIDNPYFIGAHWFQYIDSPVTGRSYDGENYNVGFVTNADIPYQPMVDAAKRIHSSMYQRRFGGKK